MLGLWPLAACCGGDWSPFFSTESLLSLFGTLLAACSLTAGGVAEREALRGLREPERDLECLRREVDLERERDLDRELERALLFLARGDVERERERERLYLRLCFVFLRLLP